LLVAVGEAVTVRDGRHLPPGKARQLN
jgi:hypothetical protein